MDIQAFPKKKIQRPIKTYSLELFLLSFGKAQLFVLSIYNRSRLEKDVVSSLDCVLHMKILECVNIQSEL